MIRTSLFFMPIDPADGVLTMPQFAIVVSFVLIGVSLFTMPVHDTPVTIDWVMGLAGITCGSFGLWRRRQQFRSTKGLAYAIPILMAAFALLASPPAAAEAAEYTITALDDVESPRPPFTTGSGANAISDNRIVAGTADSSIGNVAVTWQSGTPTNLGQLPRTYFFFGSDYGIGHDVNDNGTVVGKSNELPFVSTEAGLQSLSTLDNRFGSAEAINDQGIIAGWSGSDNGIRAVMWTSGTLQNLGTLPGGNYSEAFDINDSNTVVGRSKFDSEPSVSLQTYGFSWTQSGGMQALLPSSGYTYSGAYAVNNLGVVVGESINNDTASRVATMWASGSAISLGTLPGDTRSAAFGVNDAGTVVGVSEAANGTRRAFVWTEGLGMRSLSSLISGTQWQLEEAYGINSLGDIVGVGLNGTDTQAYMVSPAAVPEPSTYAMALAGLACGGYSMFRRRNRA